MAGLTNGNDRFQGSARADAVRGLLGNDTIFGNAGNDSLQGDSGNDTLYGGAGFDDLRGGEGNDRINGGAGTENIYGGNGNDFITNSLPANFEDPHDPGANPNSDFSTISGGAGNDTIDVIGGLNVIWGGKGVDKIDTSEVGYENFLYYNQGDTPVRETITGFYSDNTIMLQETNARLETLVTSNGLLIDYGTLHLLIAGEIDANIFFF